MRLQTRQRLEDAVTARAVAHADAKEFKKHTDMLLELAGEAKAVVGGGDALFGALRSAGNAK